MTPRRVLTGVIAALVFIVAGCGALLALPQGRLGARAALLAPELLFALPFQPSALLAPDVIQERVTYTQQGVSAEAVIWRPRDGEHSGLILSLGVNPAPPDDPRVVRLGRGLARAGLVVMLLLSPRLDEDIVEAAEIDRIVAAFTWLDGQPYTGERIGMAGFSVGASLLTIAAADPRIRERVTLVNAFGGYADLRRLAVDAVSRSYVADSRLVHWDPDALTVRLIRRHLAMAVSDPADREALLAALPDDEPPVRMPPLRTAEGRATWDFLTAADRDRAEAALARLSPATLDRLDELSPVNHAADLRAELYIMHDRNDEFVPIAEAGRLAAAARGATRVHLARFELFRHVDIGGANLFLVGRDAIKLSWHLFSVLGDLR